MAEPAPAPRSPLAALADALAGARADGVTLAERPARARLNLRLDPEDAEALAAAAAVLGAALPRTPNTAVIVTAAAGAGEDWTFLPLGPDEWLLTGPAAAGATLQNALGAALAGRHHAVCDVSAMYATLALAGANARAVLMKGCRLDLHAGVQARRLHADGARQGAGDPAPHRRCADLRDHRAQLVQRLPRDLAAGRHDGVPPGVGARAFASCIRRTGSLPTSRVEKESSHQPWAYRRRICLLLSLAYSFCML